MVFYDSTTNIYADLWIFLTFLKLTQCVYTADISAINAYLSIFNYLAWTGPEIQLNKVLGGLMHSAACCHGQITFRIRVFKARQGLMVCFIDYNHNNFPYIHGHTTELFDREKMILFSFCFTVGTKKF